MGDQHRDRSDHEDIAPFRARLQTWLADQAPRHGWLAGTRADPGRPLAEDSDAQARLARARACQRLLHDAGFAGITWPQEYGGQGLTNREQVVFNQEVGAYDLPLTPYAVGLGMCGPTVLAVGTQTQKRRYIEPMLRGDEIWCQLFSEPDAGSDVASLRTRAERAEGGWRLTGQKVWTSAAQYAAYGMILARTDPDVPKHAGLTMFILDMHAPGVTVRPLRQMNGASAFNEVFLDGVHVRDDAVLGEVNAGWSAAVVTLMTERVSIGTGVRSHDIPDAHELAAAAMDLGKGDDPVVRQAIAEVHIQEQILAAIGERISGAILAGDVPGPEGSVAKLVQSALVRRVAAVGWQIAGPAAQAWSEADPQAGRWSRVLLIAPGLSIAGGTDEIMRTIIGERVLGLPREPRVERDRPSGQPGRDRG
ncbi:MAG TPA: acyl-CoA dehydrogenase family protein [Candidatus Dormibacteraeota bacterium]